MAKWLKPDTYKEDPNLFPNRPVLLLLEVGGDTVNCLVDDVPGNQYVTIGNWIPAQGVMNGHWEYVGWDWDQDCFVGSIGDKCVGWMEMPDVEFGK